MSLPAALLEDRGWWRGVGLGLILFISALPTLPLLAGVFFMPLDEMVDAAQKFLPLLASSMSTCVVGGAIALAAGLVSGLTNTFYRYPGDLTIRSILLLPLVVPPLLWANGIRQQNFLASIGCNTGRPGLVFITAIVGTPLVMLATMTACRRLTPSQCSAARLAGGETRLLWLSARFAMPAAVSAAFFAMCLILASPGPGLALGTRTAVSEILLSFSALYDMQLAALQSVMLSVSVLVPAGLLLMLWGTGPMEMLATSSGRVVPVRHSAMSLSSLSLNLLLALLLCAAPLTGLVGPVIGGINTAAVTEVLMRTSLNTVLYSTGTALVATLAGCFIAFFMGKSQIHRKVGFSAMLLLFSLPAALPALGFLSASSSAPAWLDWLFRSRLAVCLVQGLKLMPLAALLTAGLFYSLPTSWVYAAELRGIPLVLFLRKVVLPMLLPTLVGSFTITFLLSAADTGTVLLLHPPGAQNLALAIFTIMANAPSALPAALGIFYVSMALLFLLVVNARSQNGAAIVKGSGAGVAEPSCHG